MARSKRIFNGEKYLATAYANMAPKQAAEKHAKTLRKTGHKARVVKVAGGYTVFFRKK